MLTALKSISNVSVELFLSRTIYCHVPEFVFCLGATAEGLVFNDPRIPRSGIYYLLYGASKKITFSLSVLASRMDFS